MHWQLIIFFCFFKLFRFFFITICSEQDEFSPFCEKIRRWQRNGSCCWGGHFAHFFPTKKLPFLRKESRQFFWFTETARCSCPSGWTGGDLRQQRVWFRKCRSSACRSPEGTFGCAPCPSCCGCTVHSVNWEKLMLNAWIWGDKNTWTSRLNIPSNCKSRFPRK